MSIERITSRHNPLMTHIRKLNTSRAYRAECGEYLCDGVKMLREALLWHAPLHTVVFTDGVALPDGIGSHVRCVCVPEDVMASISPMETPQGVLLICGAARASLPDTLEGKHYLVLEGVQDPGNVGTIIRTADAFACDGIFLLPGCADPFGAKTARATMGAIFRREVYQCRADELHALLQRSGIRLYGAALRDDTEDVRSVSLDRAAVAVGSEGRGLSDGVLALCDGAVKIPMSPRCESLNAAMAATVLLWEMYR